MNESDSKRSLRKSIATAEQVDGICDEFEVLLRAAGNAEIESFVDGLAEPVRSVVLRELIILEVEFRRKGGQSPSSDEYASRFPDHADLIASVFREADAAAVEEERRVERERDSSFPHGRTIGRFELREVLGQGAFGTVYRAYDPKLDREIALKVPQAQSEAQSGEISRFLKEARAAGQIRHANIVSIHEVGDADGVYFIASDLIEGESLRQRLRKGHRFTAEQTAILVRKLALALHSAHLKGVVHRDVKPGNVVLDEFDEPHVTDFGLAKRENADELDTQAGIVLGTPAYMSPEQASGNSQVAGASSDIWALSVLMFELLTGERPFTGSSEDVIHDVVHCKPRRPSDLEPSIPSELETICLRGLAKNPSDRYASCKEMAEELEAWLESRDSLGRSDTKIGDSRRVRGFALAVSLLALFGIIAVVVVIVARHSRQPVAVVDHPADEQRVSKPNQKDNSSSTQPHPTIDPEPQRHGHHDESAEPLRTVAFSPDGSAMATAGKDKTIVIWNTAGEVVQRLEGAHEGEIWSVEFSPDSRLLASASFDRTVKIWDVKTGKNVGVRRHAGPVWCVAFSASKEGEASFASASSDGTVKVWTMDATRQRSSIEVGKSTWAVAFNRDGSLLAYGDDTGGITVWDVVGNRSMAKAKNHQHAITSIAFSPNSDRFVSSGKGGDVNVWRLDRDNHELACERKLTSHEQGANHVAYSRDGTILATAGDDHKIRLWDTRTNELFLEKNAHTNPIFCVAFHPDNSTLATASGDGTARIWSFSNKTLQYQDVRTHQFRRPPLNEEYVNAIDLDVRSPNLAYVSEATTTPGEDDIYRFIPKVSGRVEFVVRPKNDLAVMMHLHDDLTRERGVPKEFNSHSSGNRFGLCREECEVLAQKVYYVRIDPDQDHERLLYELRIQPVGFGLVQLNEEDRLRSVPLKLDELNLAEYELGQINFTSEMDVYRLEPSVSSNVEIRVVPDRRRGIGLEPVVSLYAPPATSSVSDHDGSSQATGTVQFAYPLRVGNIYYLAIAAKDQASAGRYKLTLRASE